MLKEYIKELINQQKTIACLLLEESSNKKTAIEATNNYQLLIAAFEAVNKAVNSYLFNF